ncbi:MAG: hypothetical protein B7Z55_03920 [Planctomycetales bacterium 12-60-4]|nr:MAG: hypothetical protein B7Z55_03920 [Planctomycetales bacterium 12-60-4]
MRRRWMWTWMSTALAATCTWSGGCNSVAKNDNPVLRPPPRRVSLDDSATEQRLAQAEGDDSKIRQASASSGIDDSEIFNARVIARVNGAPVFAGEVLDRYGEYLAKAREKLTPEEYAQLREAIIRRDLRSHIERRLLVERMKAKLKPDQIKLLEGHIDRMFENRVAELKKQLNVTTRTELELALNERGSTLANVRDAFATERIAMEFLFGNIERPDPPTRQQLVNFYQEHLDDYNIPARVKWQEVQVSVGRTKSKAKAEELIRQAQQALAAGTPFEQVAKQYSDGPTASSGGNWDWTRIGSLADQDLEKFVFQQSPGQLSDIYFGRGAFHIVRVIERQQEGRTPFADVQDEIEKKLQADGEKDLPKQFMDKLFAEAIIETDYDYLKPEEP